MTLRMRHLLLVLCLMTPAVGPAQTPDSQTLVTRLWQARSAEESSSARADLITAAPDINTLYQWLKTGPTYVGDVPRGRQEGARLAADGARFPYVVVVPDSYDPARAYPVEFMLHGGVSRPEWEAGGDWWRRGYDGFLELEQITVVPAAWNENFWWQAGQAENLPAILRGLKQRYNIDDNRVYLTGVSDGGTGTYFFAFKQPLHWAAFLPYIGHPGVLRSVQSGGGYALYFENLMDRALFIVNGEKDPLYPASSIEPFIEVLKEANIDHEFTIIADGGHNTNWLPDQQARIDAFKQSHVRNPFPEHLIWVADDDSRYNRNAWLRIDRLQSPGRPGLVEVDRSCNEFTVNAQGVAAFTLLLNPEEINFNELVRVSVNGATLFTGQVLQDAETLLNSVEREYDRSLLYSAELSVQLPD